MRLLLGLLRETNKFHNRSGTITPPPSPTGGHGIPPVRAVLDVEGLSLGSNEVCIATLEVLAHLFSWIILSEHITPNLLDAIFACAKYHDSMVIYFLFSFLFFFLFYLSKQLTKK